MNKSLVFSVHGTPRPQPRPRFIKGRVVSTADPKAKLWRLAVERAVKEAVANRGQRLPLFTGPVRVTAVFAFPTLIRKRHGQPHTNKPDADNCEKGLWDVMEREGVFKNDSQVSDPVTIKRWGAHAGVVVTVEDISEERRAPPAAVETSPPDWLMKGLGLA